MKKKRLISILLSALLIVSVACPPFAGMSVYAAEEVAGSAATSEEAEIAEEEAEEAEIIEKDAAEPEEPAVDEIAGIDDSIEDIGDEEAVQNEEESLQDNEVETSEELVQEVIEEASENDSDDELEGYVDAEAETESAQNSAMTDNNAVNNYVAQAILTDDKKFTFYYGPLVSLGDTFNGQVIRYVFSGKEVTDTGDDYPLWYSTFSNGTNSFKPIREFVTAVVFDSSFKAVKPTSTYGWFEGCSKIEEIDLGGLNTSDVTTMSHMFYGCSNITILDITGFRTSDVTDMSYMFYHCTKLWLLAPDVLDENDTYAAPFTLDLSSFDTSNVTNMENMVAGCDRLQSVVLGNTSSVTNMNGIFANCKYLKSVDVSRADTSNVTTMANMFYCCPALTNLNLSGFDTSNVTTMANMFYGCHALTKLDLSAFDTSSVMDMNHMFSACKAIQSIILNSFDTLNVTNMAGMFYGCQALTKLDLSTFDTSNVTTMEEMFAYTAMTNLDLSGFDTSNVTDMTDMFYSSSCKNINLRGLDTSNVSKMRFMFHYCDNLTSLDLSSFETSNVTDMCGMFCDCSELESLDLSGFDTSNVTSMARMFENCRNLTSIKLYSFDTSNVVYISGMFLGCSSLTSLDLSKFDTSKAVQMESMFNGCTELISLDLSNLDTSKVKNMDYMFSNCKGLTELDLSNFDTSHVTNMNYMFSGCGSLTSINVTGFDTSKVTSVDSMFNGCESLNSLDLSSFDLSSVIYRTDSMFSGCSNLKRIYCFDSSTDWSGYISKPGYSQFLGCDSLIGVSGDLLVPYDASRVDSSMAKSADLGGYFTPKTSEGSDPDPGTNLIPQAIWTKGNTTLTFANIPQVTVGDTYNGQTITNVWSGADVTTTGDITPKWIDTVSKSVTNVVFDSSFAEVRPTSTYQWFANCGKITKIDLTGLDTSEVTDMYEMFFVCGSLTNLDVSGFDTSKATSMAYMFSGCSGLTSLDVTGFQTSNVTDMTGMFNGCSSLTSLDVSDFDTAKTTSFSYMFADCSNLTALDVSRFKTSSVEGIAYTYMFSGCSNLTGLDVSSFDISNVTKYDSMFADCSSLAIIYCADSTTNWSRKPGKEMFRNCVSLVGTSYDTTILKTVRFDSSKIDSYMATSAGFGDGGYFTPKEGVVTDNKCGENAFWVIDDGTLTIRGTGPIYDYTESNPTPWKKYAKSIKQLKVSDGITSIGDYAFYGMTNLIEINLPSSVTVIGNYSFGGCSKLKNVILPNGIRHLKDRSFKAAVELEKIFLPNSLEQIEQYAFSDSKITHVCYEGDKDTWFKIVDLTGNDSINYNKTKVHFNAKDINDFPHKDWWGFSNNDMLKNHHIDQTLWFAVLGKNIFSKSGWFKGDDDTEGGLCSGMAETPMLFDQGYTSVSDFTSSVSNSSIHGLPKLAYNNKYGMTAEDMIKLAFIMQLIPDFYETVYKANINKYDKVYDAVKHYEQTGKDPVYLHLNFKGTDHALWAYALEEEDTFSDIYIYDCNHPEEPQIVRLFGRYHSFTGFQYLNSRYAEPFTEISVGTHVEEVALAFSTYPIWTDLYKTKGVPFVSYRKKGYMIVSVADGITYWKDSYNNLIPIRLANTDGGSDDDTQGLYLCRSEDGLSLQNNTDTPQAISFTDDVCTMEIELPKGASAEYKDYQLTANCPEGEKIAGTYTSVEGEELIDISFTGSASENAKFDFSGEELIISGQPELRIEANYNDSITSTSVKADQDGSIHIKTDTVNEEDIRLIISVDNDNDGDSEEEKNYNLSGNSTSELTEENADVSFDPKGTVNNSADDPHYSYTGRAVEPELIVKTGDTVLTKEVDYTVSYTDNIKPGIAKVTITGTGSYTGAITKTFLILPGKTTRGDMFNLANNVKVTWKEVPGAKYYKVYREGITDKKETQKEPVIVTERLIGWDSKPGLTNGHAYRYKIVASLTGKGDPSGDSTLSYSKVMYRLKTVVIRSVKNTAPGKVTVKYDKTVSGDSYVLQYCERQDMVGAKTKVVLGANNTSYVIGGLKKGKTYYISIRVRKKVNGIDYYTTFGVPKKVTVTK